MPGSDVCEWLAIRHPSGGTKVAASTLGGRREPLEVVELAPLLSEATDRLHNDRSLDELIVHA